MEIRNKLVAIRAEAARICGTAGADDSSEIVDSLRRACTISVPLGVKDSALAQVFDGTALSVSLGYFLVGELRASMKEALGGGDLGQVSKHKLADLWGQVLATEELAIRVFREVMASGAKSSTGLIQALAGTVEELSGHMAKEFASVCSPRKYLNLLTLLASSQQAVVKQSVAISGSERGAQIFS